MNGVLIGTKNFRASIQTLQAQLQVMAGSSEEALGTEKPAVVAQLTATAVTPSDVHTTLVFVSLSSSLMNKTYHLHHERN